MNLIAKWRKMPNSVKSSVAFAVSTFVLRGMSFLTTPIFTRIMDQTQYGLMATYNSWLSIIEVFAVLGLTSAGVFNSGLNEYRDNRDRYIFSVLILGNFATAIVFGFIFAVKKIFVPDFIMDDNLIILMLIHFVFYPAQIFWLTRQRYEYKYKLATVVTIGSALLSQVIAVIAVINVDNNQGTVKLWANEMGWILFCVPIYFILFIRGWNTDNKERWKKILIFALPLIPHYLAQHVMSSADRIMITDLVSQADTGIYNVVANISMISVIFWNAVNASLIPYTYEKVNEKDYKPLNAVIKLLVIGYGIICVGVVMIAPEVLRILAPKEYYGGVYAVPPVAAVAFLSAFYNIYANIEFYYKKATNIAVATIVAAVVNICLNTMLIPSFSYVGAAYTTLISNIILLLMHYRGYRKCSYERIYEDRSLLLIAIVVVVINILFTILYLNDVVRYCFMLVIITVIVIKRKEFMERINGVRRELKK